MYRGTSPHESSIRRIKSIDKSSVDKRIGGSLASVIYCLNKGVNIFRVHDVHETHQAIKVYNKIECLK